MINNIRFKIIAGKINKIPEFYTIFVRKMPDYIIRQRDRGQAEGKCLRPMPKFWHWGHFGFEDLTSLLIREATPITHGDDVGEWWCSRRWHQLGPRQRLRTYDARQHEPAKHEGRPSNTRSIEIYTNQQHNNNNNNNAFVERHNAVAPEVLAEQVATVARPL